MFFYSNDKLIFVFFHADPDFLIIPGDFSHKTSLIIEMCKSRGIKVLMLNPARLAFRYVVNSDEHSTKDWIDTNNEQIHDIEKFSEYDNYVPDQPIQSGGKNLSAWKKTKISLSLE